MVTRDLLAVMGPYLLPAARVVAILVFLPGLGSPQVPAQVRLLVAGGTSVLVVGAMGARTPLPGTAEALALALVGEVALGLVIGWAVSVFLESVRWAGEMLDVQIGFRAGELFDPMTAQGTSLLGHLYYLTVLTFFFVVNGHHWALAAVARSLERIPPGEATFGAPALTLLLGAATSALDIGVRVGAAGLTALLLADLALAIVGRHVPQMNVFLVGIPAKLAAGLAVLVLAMPLLAPALVRLVSEVREVLTALLVGG